MGVVVARVVVAVTGVVVVLIGERTLVEAADQQLVRGCGERAGAVVVGVRLKVEWGDDLADVRIDAGCAETLAEWAGTEVTTGASV